MARKIIKRNSYEPTQRLEGDTIELDVSDPIQAAFKGRWIRDVLDGNFDNAESMQKTAGIFVSKTKHVPVEVGTKTVYTLKSTTSKKTMKVESDDVFNTLMDTGGFTLEDTEIVKIMQ